MRAYTFQEALSQCRVNHITLVSELGDTLRYSMFFKRTNIRPANGCGLIEIDVKWYKAEDYYEL